MKELAYIPVYLVILVVSCWRFHARETRVLRASLYAGFTASAVTTTLIVAVDQHTWNPVAYLVAFLVYGVGLALVSSFLAWIAGICFFCPRR